MYGRLAIVALGMIVGSPISAQPRPSAAEQARTLEIARAAALQYGKRLPDFLCTETIDRISLVGRLLRSRDRLTIQISYAGQQESHKLLTINGVPTERSFETLDGLISEGEFGSMLFRIFDPASATEFQWKRWTTMATRHANEYSYQVKPANSHYMLGYRTPQGAVRTAVVGYRGEIVVDVETSMALRLSVEALHIPRNLNIFAATMMVEYGFRDVAGASHLLPVRAESEMRRSTQSTQNVVTFTDYRKFTADSVVTFR